MAETDATLLRQFPLFLPQNRAKTVYEGFISAQVFARLMLFRSESFPLAVQPGPWKSVTRRIGGIGLAVFEKGGPRGLLGE